MLSKLTPSVLRNLHVLVRTDQWRAVNEALNAELLATYERMRDTVDTPTLHELRGRARLLSEILVVTSSTQEKLDKIARR
jgi:hypothetical protein